MKYLIILILCIFASFPAQADSHADAQARRAAKPCTDFLAAVNKSHPQLVYEKCELGSFNNTGRLMISHYRVKGQDAVTAEKYLMKISKMKKLGFYCCYHGTPDKGSITYGEDHYIVDMNSGETNLSKRSQWRHIPFFTVTLTYYIDEP